jgi:putative CocE/NonD family hydrolase
VAGRTDGDKVGDSNFGYKTSDTYKPLEYAFFRHYLKGGDKPALPKAMVFETGANRWRQFDSWPPKQAKAENLYLMENGKLSFRQTAQTQPFSEYISDPAKPVPYTTETLTGWSKNYVAADQRFAASRPDVLVFQSDVLEQDVTLAGPLEADLFASVTGTDADFVVKLIDVLPANAKDGEVQRGHAQILVRGEPFRARYRDSYSQPKALVPNEVTRIRFGINDVMHTFQRGHRIMVQVQSSWFPFIDRNPQTFVPNIYQADEKDFIKANHRIWHNASYPSALKVRILPAS